MPANDLGFDWDRQGDTVRLLRYGKPVTVLRGDRAAEFLDEADGASVEELQQLLARLTGRYKHGNERNGKNHPRNRR